MMNDLRIVDEVVGHVAQWMRPGRPLRPGDGQLVRREVRDLVLRKYFIIYAYKVSINVCIYIIK